ncbi:hypothetical protein B0A48_01134 [Cryoendolithus antarcticus]|uniref:D-lactate dehydratase n=1 Tax=Cryoendolithus antarcticus TaxID=1507870 RepID=A0A1V8TSD6_9PEZI|nr:hypothetical protein B0A48_01134 [Cryoendolithus antarcticus]
MSLPRRALIAVTSATAPLHHGKVSGLFISEALHPYNVFTAAGFEVIFTSEKGTYAVDWLSEQDDFLPADERKQWEDVNGEFRKQLDGMPKAATIKDGKDFGIFFASAGHAALIDYPTATNLQRIASDVYAAGGVVSAVCHGAALLPRAIDSATGKSIIAGKTVTGFTTEGEEVMGIDETLRKEWKVNYVDELVEAVGAKYVRPAGIWDDQYYVDGRIVSGVNPQSAKSTAEAAVRVFEGL